MYILYVWVCICVVCPIFAVYLEYVHVCPAKPYGHMTMVDVFFHQAGPPHDATTQWWKLAVQQGRQHKVITTVDGQNPAPPGMVKTL